MNTSIAIALLIGVALTTPAAAQTVRTKTYDIEMMHLRVSGFQSPVEGWLFMIDVKGQRSRMELAFFDTQTGAAHYLCSVSGPDGVIARTPGDYDIVQVGKFAQQATAAVLPGSLNTVEFSDFVHSFCTGPNPKSLTVSPYEGVTAPEALQHVTINHTGTYRSSVNGQSSTYTQKGHRDSVLCDILIDGVPYEGHATLTRLTSTHVGQPNLVMFSRDPSGWVSVGDLSQ
jgi:hypothetical protein